MQEMLWIGFYLWYAIEYLCIMLSCKWNKQGDRYHDVSFEEEAHNNDKNLNYCKERKHYAWFKYLKIENYIDRFHCRKPYFGRGRRPIELYKYDKSKM